VQYLKEIFISEYGPKVHIQTAFPLKMFKAMTSFQFVKCIETREKYV